MITLNDDEQELFVELIKFAKRSGYFSPDQKIAVPGVIIDNIDSSTREEYGETAQYLLSKMQAEKRNNKPTRK